MSRAVIAGEPAPGKVCHLVPGNSVPDGKVGNYSCARLLGEHGGLPFYVSHGEEVVVQYADGPRTTPFPECNAGREFNYHARIASDERDVGLWYERRLFVCPD